MNNDYICNKCGYRWTSRKGRGEPAYCPRCSSKRIELDEHENKILYYNNKNKTKVIKCAYCNKRIRDEDVSGYCSWLKERTKNSLFVNIGLKFAESINIYKHEQLCKDCIKRCKYCKKIFCPDHLKIHHC